MIALDSSVALPALLADLPGHDRARRYLTQEPAIAAHAAVETFSAMTRLPDPFRVDAPTAAQLVEANFRGRILAGPRDVGSWLAKMARAGISGGAVYDALVAESARRADATLVTADRRAAATYRAVGVEVQMLGD